MHGLTSFLTPLHPEGHKFVAIAAALTVVLFVIWEPLGWLGVIAALWCAYFFRDPQRVPPDAADEDAEEIVVAPADGIVCFVGDAVPPAELGLDNEPRPKLSIFMNVFNCHVNRAPVAGLVERIAYRPGAFVNASLDKASEDNERNAMLLRTPKGDPVVVVQIAGLVARRIVCQVSEGDSRSLGERFGISRFGSRLDVYLPRGNRFDARVGQTMVAGETVVAHLSLGDEAEAEAEGPMLPPLEGAPS